MTVCSCGRWPCRLTRSDQPCDPGSVRSVTVHDGRFCKGDVRLYWGATFDPDDSKTVLGFEKAAPESGGSVLMRDGSVVQMTAAEYQAAPKPADGVLADPPAEKSKKR